MEFSAEMLYKREKELFCEYAVFSENTKGRKFPIEECTFRTPFRRDRDRIIHSKSFRRLMHKTQCFLSPEGDHYRTRLTHTLEVNQIAQTIARALRLNEDLCEAAALGHDLGHTPFGHAGERALDSTCTDGFWHNEPAHRRYSRTRISTVRRLCSLCLRTVDILERDGEGLNLTYEVRNAILCHTGKKEAETLEGKIIKFADRIAYINHDIDDAVRAGVISTEQIPKELCEILGNSHGARIDAMVKSVIEASEKTFAAGSPNILMDDEIFSATEKLREFMFENVYFNPVAKSEESKACAMLESLYYYFVKNPDKISEEYKRYLQDYSTPRVVCDYIAGMTDRYAVSVYENIFVPKVWAKR